MRRVRAPRAERGLHDARSEKLKTPLRVEGVGNDAQCHVRAIVHINLASGQTGAYTAPVVPRFPIPAMYGQMSLRAEDAFIDSVHSRLHLLGPGLFDIQAPAGSRKHDTTDSPSGHTTRPITEFYDCVTGGSTSASSSL